MSSSLPKLEHRHTHAVYMLHAVSALRRSSITIRAGLIFLSLSLAASACSAGKSTPTGTSQHARTSSTPTASGTKSSPSPAAPGSVNVYAAATGAILPRLRSIPERVYIPNVISNSIDVVDPATFKIIDHYSVGREPQHVTPSRDMRWLYVDQGDTGQLTVIDPVTGKIARVIPNVTDPYNLYFTLDGTKAIVVAEDKKRLDFRDPQTFRLIRSVSVPWPGVDHLDFTADGRFLLATTEYSGMVVKVDTVKMAVVGHVHVGGLPIDVRLSPDGSVFFVANQGLSGASVVDPVHMRVVKFIHTGVGAHGFAVSRNARLFYLSNRIEGTISVLDPFARRVVRTWRVGGSPDMMQVSPDGSQLWFSNRFDGYVTVISTRTGRVLAKIRTETSPHGLCYFPQPGTISLGHNGVYR
jgi:YVTN family beta-propeller protein